MKFVAVLGFAVCAKDVDQRVNDIISALGEATFEGADQVV